MTERFLKIFLLAGDIAILYIALFLSALLRSGNFQFIGPSLLYYFSVIYFFWILLLFALDFYEINFLKNRPLFFTNLAIFSFCSLFFGIAFFYFRQELVFTPKTVLVLDVAIFDGLFFLWRSFFNSVILKNVKEQVIIIGIPPRLDVIFASLEYSGWNITTFFASKAGSHDVKSGVKIISKIEDLQKIVEAEKVKLIVIADDSKKYRGAIQQVLDAFPEMAVMRFEEFYELLTKRILLDTLHGVWFLPIVYRSESKAYLIMKRAMDISLATLFFLVTIILFPLIALGILFDSKGPIFYNQQRVGAGGTLFTIHKFRTMQDDKEKKGKVWREKQEGQVTRFGAFLRRFHLDELPQFWSIAKGDLSFVGPRPEWIPLAKLFEIKIPFYRHRYLVKPGLTGWAQINFPASSSVKQATEKFEYDLYYIKHRSLLLDIEIILKTVRLIIRRQM